MLLPAGLPRGLVYTLSRSLYVALTNECAAGVSLVASRGPSFAMPTASGFVPLEREPTAAEVFEAVDYAWAAADSPAPSSGGEAATRLDTFAGRDPADAPFDEIVFAGLGDPLLQLDVLCDAAALIKGVSWSRQLRVGTRGLVPADQAEATLDRLVEAGIDRFTINLDAANPPQYAALVEPHAGAGFSDVCSFVVAAAERGCLVTAAAVDRPGVDVKQVEAMARGLGCVDFRARPWFP